MGFEASMLKIRGTEVQQLISELTVEALSYYALPSVPEQLEYGYNDQMVGGWETGYAARSYSRCGRLRFIRGRMRFSGIF